MKIGLIYETDLGLVHFVDIIEKAMRQRGFACETSRVAESEIHIEATQTAPWFRVLLLALPQRLRWKCQVANGKTVAHFDWLYFRWYRYVVMVLWTLLIGMSLAALTVQLELRYVDWVAKLVPVTLVLLFLFRLTVVDGPDVKTDMLEQIREELRSNQCYLEDPSLHRSLPRPIIHAMSLSVFFVVFLSLMVFRDATEFSIAEICVAVFILIIIGFAIRLGILVYREKAAIYRMVPLIPSMYAILGIMLVFVGLCLPSQLFGTTKVDEWNAIFDFRERFEHGEVLDPPSFVDALTAEEAYPLLKEKMALVPIGGGALCLLGLAVFIVGLGTTKGVLQVESRFRSSDEKDATVQAAISGRTILMTIRFLVIPAWLFLGTVNMLCIVVVIWTALGDGKLIGEESIGAVEASAGVIEFLTHQPQQSALPLARMLWLNVALLVVLLPVISIGLLLLRSLRLWHLVHTFSKNHSRLDCTRIQGRLDELSDRANCAAPRLVLADGGYRSPVSFTLSLRGRSRFILLPNHYVTLLDDDELEALLSHELAHHICGHCNKHLLLQLLGRITFVGDGYIGALENSFGYELEADRIAIEELGTNPEALERCLLKIAATSTLDRLIQKKATGLGMTSANEEPPSDLALPQKKMSMIEQIRLWCKFYVCDTAMSYWHPSVARRIAVLNTADQS